MYLFYLDESGDPNSWTQNDNFILAGVAIHEGQVRRLSEQLNAIQHRFFPSIPMPIEFHAQHIHGAKDRFRQMNPTDRVALLESAYDVIGNAGFPNLIAFITAIHVSAVTSPSQAQHRDDACVVPAIPRGGPAPGGAVRGLRDASEQLDDLLFPAPFSPTSPRISPATRSSDTS